MSVLEATRAVAVGAAVLLLAACSSGGGSGIAHLGGDPAASASPSASGSAEDQALAFAQCMRDNGVTDFPDPTVNADGTPSFQGAFGQAQSGGIDPGDSSFRTAITACGSKLQGIAFGGGRAGGNFDPTAIQDAMLKYTQCLRDQGLDVGDLTFNGPGLRGPGADAGGTTTGGGTTGASPAPGDGPPRGEFQGGDPTNRFAEILGQDPTDPAWIKANTACATVLQTALASVGFGGGAAGGTTTGSQG